MTITLPRLPRASDYDLRPVEGTSVQRSANGVALPLSRAWDHFEVEIDVGALSPECAGELTVDLLAGVGQRIRVPLPMQGVDVGAPGVAVVVDGADQSGSSLAVRGGTPHAVIRKGWKVTVITDGVGRLHMVRAETVFGADSKATLPLWPMMRVPPSDGDPVEVAEPFLEGFRAEGGNVEIGLVNAARPGAFVIEEQD